MSLTHKGVNYDTGTNYGAGGALSREVWRPDMARLEIQAIRDQLRCNAIGIFGTDVDRLAQAASIASEHGLYVWLQPRLVDANAHQMLDHLGEAARDEQVQADQIAELIGIYEAEGIDGAFVFEFIEPSHPHADDPRQDLDMAGYGIVKVLPDQAPGSYRWEPKAAFHTVARLYESDSQTQNRPSPR